MADMHKSLFGAVLLVALVFPAEAVADPSPSDTTNTTCTYEQVDAALSIRYPKKAKKLHDSEAAQKQIKAFLDAPDKKRRSLVGEYLSDPETQEYLSMISDVVGVCHGY